MCYIGMPKSDTRSCERGGMADTAVLEAAAERRGGSSPFVRTKALMGGDF